MRGLLLVATILAAPALAVPALAQISTEIPPPSQTSQGEVSVTIYNNNLALVQDRRQLDIGANRSRLEFPDVSAQIRPETVTLTGPDIGIVEQNFDFDLLSPQALMQKAHTGLNECLPFFRRLVLGVLAQVPKFPRVLDNLRQGVVELVLEIVYLRLQFLLDIFLHNPLNSPRLEGSGLSQL